MTYTNIISTLAASLLLSVSCVFAHSPPESAKVFFVNLKDGASVGSPFNVVFGIKGFGITTAGDHAKRKHVAGHHHLLLDLEQLPDMQQPLPYTPNIIHYDLGETEATLELPPGLHSLQLLLADEEHEPHEPPLLSDKITVRVTK